MAFPIEPEADPDEIADCAVVESCDGGCTILALANSDGRLAEIHLSDEGVVELMSHLGASLYRKGVVRWRN